MASQRHILITDCSDQLHMYKKSSTSDRQHAVCAYTGAHTRMSMCTHTRHCMPGAATTLMAFLQSRGKARPFIPKEATHYDSQFVKLFSCCFLKLFFYFFFYFISTEPVLRIHNKSMNIKHRKTARTSSSLQLLCLSASMHICTGKKCHSGEIHNNISIIFKN